MNDVQEGEEDFVPLEGNDAFIERKIMHVFSVYGPRLSPSMLQVGIGTAMSPRLWHPILDRLIKNGRLEQTTLTRKNDATGRDQSYTVISLPPVIGAFTV